MTDAAPSPDRPRRARSQHVLTVLRTERLTGHLVRVHLGGDGLDAFLAESDPERLAATDRYVKLLLPPRGSDLQPPFDLDALRASVAPEQLPVRRTYTVRSVDLERRSIAVDFVVHGDEGVAGPWALAAAPGDRIALSAPGGAWSPSADPEVVHLLLGDDSALPAIASALEGMPAHARGLVLIEVDSAADELDLPAPAGVEVRWLHRGGLEAGRALVAAVRAEPRPEGVLEVFAHGERTAMKQLRALLQDEWGVERRALSLSAYWALGRAEDRFQAEKREPVGAIFAD
ncbi:MULTISPECIES: siderophore-interacting protein [unclassified Rathayibacter]|uniref:siderophore-interacting protein n=1 Tax=unclassified Rathayibacter TaxID=2609250 RepID=UPI000CE8A9F1|nr:MULTISPECIES: siderophore-interacting protein [unclassified Rathayibacter]PPG10269.1 NADPH-dependent ferric siderophore reductase [Rathayibacter sp. AY2B1]PPG13565.1 NADPH-dependent ferric siderophore reductase [Rathayibacter sp. AY1C6]PPG73988.1 NADPH-dependent ferric siderophore reductase [Rathayibacter sp. AY1F4]PPH89518.1 NADPH-dependent ferric siderophore reductase [Rathayibacter sp. AY1D5]